MDATQTTTPAGSREAGEPRRDSGVVFLVGMAVAALVAVFASLALVDAPAGPSGTNQAQVSTP